MLTLITLVLTLFISPPINIITMNNISQLKVDTNLPMRKGKRPATTKGIPHVQLDLDKVEHIHNELIKRVYSIDGIDNKPSVILSWKGLWVHPSLDIKNPSALISQREFGHFHDDGSLHLFLEPNKAKEAIETGWAISHPYATSNREGWEGFVMLYTPQNTEQMDVVFQLIIDSFNHVTGKSIDTNNHKL